MSLMLSHASYYDRPPAKNVATRVLKREGEWYLLEQALLFPGGGGQDADRGTINGLEVKALDKREDGVWHNVPGLDLEPGGEADVVLDWEHRYLLMSAHTGEHLLFSGLKIVEPALENRKVSFKEGHYSLFLDGPLTPLVVQKALVFANNAILAGAKVCRDVHPIAEAKALEGVRAQWENFDTGDVSVITIENIDSCACGGVHLEDVCELGSLAVKRFVKSQEADWQLDFVFGGEAFELLCSDNGLVLELRELLKLPRDTMLPTLQNMFEENTSLKDSVNDLAKVVLERLGSEDVDGLKFFGFCFPGVNQKLLNQFASSRTKEPGSVVLLGNHGKRLSVVMAASQDSGLDCKEIMTAVIDKFNGNGGGKPEYFQAGLDPGSDWGEITTYVLGLLKTS